MGRPRGSKNKTTLVKLGLGPDNKVIPDKRTDDEILATIIERFEIFWRMIIASTDEGMNALIGSGSAGVGKSYTAEMALEQMKQKKGTKFKIVRGAVSAIGLYQIAYEMRQAGDVIIMDDADRIFDDEDGLNILKSLLDTSLVRKVCWYTDHAMFKGEDGLPHEFDYAGSMIFLTNKNFQEYVDLQKGRYVEHMEALMSRSIYLDLKMHSRREIALWAKHLVLKNKILQAHQIGCTAGQERAAVDWVISNRDNLREISIRTIIKLGRIMKAEPDQWQRVAAVTLLREEKRK